MEVDFEPEERDWLLYDLAVEEIALEGLDGITLQALFERIVDRECGAISRDEGDHVRTCLWNALRKDHRLNFYILPEARPTLEIWNRNLHHDDRGNIKEPVDAPEEIYRYKCVEVKHDNNSGWKRSLSSGRRKRLSPSEIDRIQLGKGEGEVVLNGLRFRNSVAMKEKGSSRGSVMKVKVAKADFDRGTGEGGIVAVRGSCQTFESRKNVTNTLRKINLTYQSAVTILGNYLVIVASQFVRESLLLRNANQEFNGVQYCMVERVGRSRRYGEQGRGKISLTTMGIGAKTLFYHRIILLEEGVITKQPLVMKFGSGTNHAATLITVFHLPYFFRRQDSPEAIKTRKIFAYVHNAPHNRVERLRLQQIFGKHFLRYVVGEYKDFLCTEDAKYAELYPVAVEEQHDEKKKEALLRRTCRVLTLKNKDLTLRELIQKQICKQESQDEEETADGVQLNQYQDDKDENDTAFDWSTCYFPERVLANESELSQLLRLIIEKGSQGITIAELSSEMGITNLDSRSGLRFVGRWKFANPHMEVLVKTKVTRWTYFKCEPKTPAIDAVHDVSEGESESDQDGKKGTGIKSRAHVWKSKQKLPVPFRDPLESTPSLMASTVFTNDRSLKLRETEEGYDALALPNEEGLNPRKRQVKRKRRASKTAEMEFSTKQLTKRRKFIDLVDKQAIKNREKQRAIWSPDEDRALLYVFIATVLFIPRYNLDRIAIYNPAQLRDVLHRKMPETTTKTSLMVRRRVHSLLKLKSSSLYRRFKTLLHAALLDEELYTRLIEPHLPPPSSIIFHKIPDSAIEELVDYIVKRFEWESRQELEPRQMATKVLHDLARLMDARELRRLETVWIDIWGNVFHKFYGSKKTLTLIVPRRPETDEELEREGLVIEDQGPSWILPYITVKAPSSSKSAEKDEPPCIYSDEQLDFAYDTAILLISGVDRLMREGIQAGSSSSEEDMVLTQRSNQKHGRVRLRIKDAAGPVDICSGERDATRASEVFSWSCRTIFMSALMGGGGGTPESLKTYMDCIPDRMLDRVATTLRGLSIYTTIKPNRRLVLTNHMKRKLTHFLHPVTFRSANLLLATFGVSRRKEVLLECFKNIGSAYVLSELAPLVRIDVTIPNSLVTIKDDCREDYENLVALEPVPEGAEETALRFIRLRLNADNETLVRKDFFDIILPQVRVSAQGNIPMGLQEQAFGKELQLERIVMENRLIQFVAFDEVTGIIGSNEPITSRHKELYGLIDICGEAGISILYLLKHWNRTELEQGLTYLLHSRNVYAVGIRHRKFVTSRHMQDWSICFMGNEEIGTSYRRIVSHTWVDANGDVNWKLVDRAIVRLLGILRRYPHVMVEHLAHSMSPLLSYVEALILINILIDLQIVDIFQRHKKREDERFNLFSKWEDIEDDCMDLESPVKTYGINPLLDIEEAWVELMPFHVSKYSRIQALILPQDEQLTEEDFEPEEAEAMGQVMDEQEDDEES